MKLGFAKIILLAAVASGLKAQTTALLPPPQSYFTDNNGLPLSGGLIYTYQAGTTTPLASYTDSTGATPNTNPVVLNVSGRANIWLANQPYKIVVKTSAGVTISTTDNVYAGGYLNSGPWLTSGTTLYNGTAGTKVCISATPCTTALAQLDVVGTSSGTSYLVRIDDSGNSPGINLYGSGNNYGSYAADSAGLRLRSGSGDSQVVVSQGNVTIQDASSAGSTALTLKAGAAQGSTYLFTLQNNAGTNLAYADSVGRFVAPLYNALVPTTPTDITFQNADSSFSVNGQGDISAKGSLNVLGASGGTAAYKVNGINIIDSAGNATFTSLTCTGTPCGSGGGGGGSGTPGGASTQVQYNASGAFAGSANFTWDNVAKLLTVTAADSAHAGIAVSTGFMQADKGFLAPAATATNYDSVQAPAGGMHAKSFTAINYVQVGSSAGAPTTTTGDTFNAGAIYWDTGTAALKVYNGASWVTLSTGGATSPGGADTNIQYNSAGSFGGSSALTWDNASKLLTITGSSSASPAIVVGTSYIQSDAGFYATVGTATAYNAIQAPGGGMAAKSFTATKYIQIGSGASNPTVTASDTFNPGAMYWNTTSSQPMIYNGSAWVALLGSGGGGTPGGSNSYVQFNNSGTFGGVSNLRWDDSLKLLTVTGPGSASPAIAVSSGYVQSDGGFYATSGTATNYNSIQAPGGGVYAKSMGALNYTQVGSAPGIPSLTTGDAFRPGALYFSTSLGQLQVFNGASWATVGGGGSSGVTSISGTANQVITSGSTGAVTLSLPQAIAASSNVQFNQIVSTGVMNSVVTGASLAFQGGNGLFQVYGNGSVNASIYNASTGFQVNGQYAINSSRQFVGAGVDVGPAGVNAGNYNVNGGYIGQTWNVEFPSPFTINGSSYSTLVFRGGILVSAF